MFGMFGPRLPRLGIFLIAGFFLLLASLLGVFYFWSPHATLRVTTGPEGSIAQRFISAFIAASKADHPRIRFETVTTPNLEASAKALEDGKVDIALVRSDFKPPANGDTLVILRRVAIAIVLPPDSSIDDVAKLSGKTVAIPTGPTQEENSAALDLILSYYNVPADAVKRVFLPVAEIGAAIHHKHAAAVLAVGPIGPGVVVDVVAAIAKATRGTPTLLALDDAEAIGKRFPGFESLDIPEGGFKAHPEVPDDSVTTLAVTYRFAVPDTMLKVVAGALARSILKAKGKLMALSPVAAQIEAPDPDEKNPVLPIHPGVSDYISNGDQSFLDEAQQYFYIFGIPLSLSASVIALVAGSLGKWKAKQDQQEVSRLLVIADEARKANASELAALESELHAIVAACVSKLADGSGAADQGAVSLAVEHARRSIESRKTALGGSLHASAEFTSTA